MSGGTYDRVCWKSAEDLRYQVENIRQIADRLRELDERGAAIEMDAHADRIEGYFDEIDDRHGRLSDVMKAVDWFDSGDWGPERVHEACDEL